MPNLNQAMPRELPPFIDKLLMTCLVTLDRIEQFHCEICDKLYCQKEALTDHLTTHIKKEIATDFDETMAYGETTHIKKEIATDFNETMAYGESGCSEYNLDSNTGHTFRKIKSDVNSATQCAFLSIRDRIKFENEDTIDAAIKATREETKQMTNAVNNSSKFPDTSSTSNNKHVLLGHVNLKKSYGSLIPCKTCYEMFAHHSSLKSHEAICHKKSVEKPKQIHFVHMKKQITKHICPIFCKVFPCNHLLSLHSKFNYSHKSWECNKCEKTFKLQYQLKNHQRVHTDERPYSCAICNIHFRNCSSLQFHNRRKHTPEEQHPTCDICNMRYPEKTSLERHMLSVHMTSGYRCRICKNKKEYGHPLNLAKHMYTHSPSKNPLKCHLCNVTFSKKFHKDRHVELTHKKILNFECDMCKKKFGRKDHLMRHITNRCCLEPYKCRKCKRSFSKLAGFKKHKMKCKKK